MEEKSGKREFFEKGANTILTQSLSHFEYVKISLTVYRNVMNKSRERQTWTPSDVENGVNYCILHADMLFLQEEKTRNNVSASENRVRLRNKGKTFVGWKKLSFSLYQKEKCNCPFWPLASKTYPIAQLAPGDTLL
ncbi:UNVERIFIED_CONTAM: hypothetical protein NCL1_47832 [Trichonephila clavipes]